MNTSKFLLGSLLVFSASVFAEEGKFYVGASGGKADIETGVSGTTGTANLDEDDTGWKVYAGYKWDNNFGLEFNYANFGEASLSGNNGDQFVLDGATYEFTANGVNIDLEGTTFGLALTYSLPVIDDTFFIDAKVGAHSWDADMTVSADAAGSVKLSDSGTDPFYGLGLTYQITEEFGAKVEFERYEFDKDDVDYISAGLTFSF